MIEEPSDETNACPVCCNKMTSQDELLFFPCPCNYQLCAFCFDKLKNDSCPHCRKPYNSKAFRTLTPEQFTQQFPDRKLMSFKPRFKGAKPYKMGSSMSTNSSHFSKAELINTRVLQSNLVYVTGVPNSLTVDELKSSNFFGRYGTVLKIVPKHSAYPGTHRHTHALYVTYSTEESAKDCILSSTETYLGGNLLKCSFGTTKFCNSFLDGKHCLNKECMFLHDLRDDHIIFTESDMVSKRKFNEHTHPKVPPNRITYADNPNQLTGLPPSWEKEQNKEFGAEQTRNLNKTSLKLTFNREQDQMRQIEIMSSEELDDYIAKLANLVFSGTSLFFPLPPYR